MKKRPRFNDVLRSRPRPSGLDLQCTLQHFSIVTYAVDPSRFTGRFPDRFEPDLVQIGGESQGLISAVSFVDNTFTSAAFPLPKFKMNQTDYRIYIVDRNSGEHCIWFLGTTYDSWTLPIPRRLWQLPWHPGVIRFSCDVDERTGRYRRYDLATTARWAGGRIRLSQSPGLKLELGGFADTESGLVCLTHALTCFYFRRDGKLGTYRVWHDRLKVAPARLESARFELLEREHMVTMEEQQRPHSVLLEPVNEFTVYLPPTVL